MSIRFYCAYCAAEFLQLKDLIEHFENQHNAEEYPQYLTDVRGYSGADLGCEQATAFLGYQSSCLKCPFKKCVLEEKGIGLATQKKLRRNEEIKSRFQAGAKIKDLAVEYGVSQRTIERVIAGRRNPKRKGSRR